jgi:hypothetical protein
MVAPIPRARSDRAVAATFELVSRQPVSVFPGNRIQRTGDRMAKNCLLARNSLLETATGTINPPIGRIFAACQEIPADAGLRGGLQRTRTVCQARSHLEPVSENRFAIVNCSRLERVSL